MSELFTRLADRIKSHHKNTALYAFFSTNESELQGKIRETSYQNAKYASDVVAMITRMGFCLGAIVFFYQKSTDNNNLFDYCGLITACAFSVVAFVYLVVQVLNFIAAFLIHSPFWNAHRVIRIIGTILSIGLTALFFRGILILIFTLSNKMNG